MSTDLREQLLSRLQACVSTLAPGVVFTFPAGYTHRAIETDIKGRCYSKWRGIQRFDLAELPAVLIITDDRQPDIVTPFEDNFYRREMVVQLQGYVASGDMGDGLDATVRPDMDAFLADLQIAVEAFPYWTNGADITESLCVSHGPITIMPKSQLTEPAADQAFGILVLDYSIAYTFPRLNP